MSSHKSNVSDEQDLSAVRKKANEILTFLDEETKQSSVGTNNSNNYYYSWVRGGQIIIDSTKTEEPTSRCQYFDKNGFLLIKGFSDEDEIQGMKRQMHTLVDEHWDPNTDSSNSEGKKNITVFRTDDKQIDHQGSDDYFLESANKVHFFAESRAIDDNGNLKHEYLERKMLALNKAGHGLHMIPGYFHDYTTSEKIKNIVMELGWKDAVVPQSMYIFKQARVGGEVTSHQDSTFLYTTPRQTCLGLWLALDDATLTNGCLWVRPYSHKERVRRIFTRNPDHFGNDAIKSRSNKAMGDMSQSQMIFTEEPGSVPIPWDGCIPRSTQKEKTIYDTLFDVGFIPIECKAGDLLVFPGELDHLSLANFSENQRHTFQLHLVEGERAGISWSETNWLQYPKDVPFLSLNGIVNSNSNDESHYQY